MIRLPLDAWDVAAITLVGDRDNNQDFMANADHNGVLVAVVADGLGGHAFGEWASQLFCEALMAHAPDAVAQLTQPAHGENSDKRVLEGWFDIAIDSMRDQVRRRDENCKPHTTAVVGVILPDRLLVAHVGDSRAYRLSPGGGIWRTRDHSLVQMLLDDGEITEQQMGTHPDQGKLFKAIGMDSVVRPSVKVLDALAGDEALLLCSDGFWEFTEPDELAELRSARDSGATLRQAAERACRRAEGKSDNVTALLIRPTAWRRWLGRLRIRNGVSK